MKTQQIIPHGAGNTGQRDVPGSDTPRLKKIHFKTIDGMSGIVLCLVFLTAMVLAVPTRTMAQTWLVEKAFKEVNLRGYTRSIKTAVISAEVTGKLLRLNYDVGDVIGKEDLARIDPTFVDFEIKSTRVALEQIKIRIKKITSRITFLTREFQRKETLFAKGRTTEVIRDAAAQELDQAVLELGAIRQEERSLAVTLDQLEEKKARHGVRGPEKWVLTEKKVEVGEVVQAGMPLAVVQDFTQLVVPLAVSADELEGILEKKNSFTGLLEDHPVQVGVDHISPEFDETTRKIRIQLIIPDAGMPHRGGLRFMLPVRCRIPGMKIPSVAVVNRYANPRVFVKGGEEPTPITILDTVGEDFIVAETAGIQAGTLLTDGPGEKAP